ncbi:MAG: hypothetical protein AAB895_02525 [Patescibacteria group bacterium]
MKSKFIIFTVAIILIVVGLGVFTNKAQGPGKFDEFAQALKAGGAEFYGAFWCPHCQEQKKSFGTSKKYLPYIECSNPDQSVTDICIDKKIESYPSWMFTKAGISLVSTEKPTICTPKPGIAGEEAICAQVASKYYKTYMFPGYKFSVKSPTEPVKKADVWQFPVDAVTQGEIPLEFLAQQIGFTLPQ